jgi:O-antigen/teichoic acid export membrane protein
LKKMNVRPAWTGPTQFRQALLASLPLGTTVALVVILHYANNLIVRAYLGAAVLGVFLAAFRLLELATTVPGMLSTVFLPRLTRFVVKDVDTAGREARIFAKVHMIVAFFIAAFMLAEAPAIINIIYGAKYTGAVDLLRLMAVAVIFNYAICGYTNCLISFGRDRVMLTVAVVAAVVSVGGGLLLVPRLGAIGAALVVACIDLAGWLVSLPYYRHVVGSLQFRAWIWPVLGAGCITIFSLLFQAVGLSMWVRAPLAMLAYAPFVWQEIRNEL